MGFFKDIGKVLSAPIKIKKAIAERAVKDVDGILNGSSRSAGRESAPQYLGSQAASLQGSNPYIAMQLLHLQRALAANMSCNAHCYRGAWA